MADIFKFPNNGYDVVIVRKEEILSTIEGNILDKEVALDIVRQLETDAASFLSEGKWVGIPFVGNIRIPVEKQIINNEETQNILAEAREILQKDDYLMFRKELTRKAYEEAKNRRYYKYILSQCVVKNRKLWLKWCEKYGETRANIMIFTCIKLKEPRTNDKYYIK